MVAVVVLTLQPRAGQRGSVAPLAAVAAEEVEEILQTLAKETSISTIVDKW